MLPWKSYDAEIQQRKWNRNMIIIESQSDELLF